MLLNEIKPSDYLAQYIRLYRIIDFNFSGSAAIPPKFYSPRPEQCLQFYPKEAETVSYPDTKQVIKGKRTSCVGQHNILQQRQVGKEFLSLQVVFQPGAFFRLTGISMRELLNQYLDAADVFGSVVSEVNERLYHALSYNEMILVVERFLLKVVKAAKKGTHPVDISGSMMLLQEENFRLDSFLKQACICHRQFDRMFGERLGVSPKQFLRIVRFDKAYRMKNRFPHLDWLSIAIRSGYHDYQHLVKDYKAFTGYTPPQFFALDSTAPERIFGDAEV